jgi:glutathione peroxidase
MKTLIIGLLLSFSLTGENIYEFKVPGLEGGEIDFAKFKGKKILIVNTASHCGNTGQYADLQKLYEEYKDKLVIVGFPANNFKGQEPGTNEEIAEFCKKNYGVSFPMAEKVSVKGEDIHPLFKWLVNESREMAKAIPDDNQARKTFLNDPILWNFTKFLIDENGKLITPIFHKTSVLSEDVTKLL